MRVVLALVMLAGCDAQLVDLDQIYTRGAPHFVMCGMDIDDKNSASLDAIGGALDRAQLDGTTVLLYAHKPGDLPNQTVDPATVELALAGVVDRGMQFATYSDLAAGEVPGSLALAFDDHDLAGWSALRETFNHYGARVTFFVSLYPELTADEKAELRQLAADGHDIEYHSTHHDNAADYANAHGADAYITDDILPGLQAMRDDGWNPTIFAYPFGARTAATDKALEPLFTHIRAIYSTCPY
ncbi:MAG: polysaccharide deacetylase family protein [Deltaproteobacteria bacterium]|nr:polysaccharide deacetylase family protein [Deltaproteobacteria bacterium]